jgi:hypothetical protein
VCSARGIESTGRGPSFCGWLKQLRDVVDAIVCSATCDEDLATGKQRCCVTEALIAQAAGSAPRFCRGIVEFRAAGSIEETRGATGNRLTIGEQGRGMPPTSLVHAPADAPRPREDELWSAAIRTFQRQRRRKHRCTLDKC